MTFCVLKIHLFIHSVKSCRMASSSCRAILPALRSDLGAPSVQCGSCVHSPSEKADLFLMMVHACVDNELWEHRTHERLVSKGHFDEYALNVFNEHKSIMRAVKTIARRIQRSKAKNGFVLISDNLNICKSRRCHRRRRCKCPHRRKKNVTRTKTGC